MLIAGCLITFSGWLFGEYGCVSLCFWWCFLDFVWWVWLFCTCLDGFVWLLTAVDFVLDYCMFAVVSLGLFSCLPSGLFLVRLDFLFVLFDNC